MPTVLLATCAAWPQGEPAGHLLTEGFAAAGAQARWVRWDDATVDWAAADVVAARSTWDYVERREEFLAWARSVGPRLLNGAAVFEWNTHKSYLVGLGELVPVVPTVLVDDADRLREAVAAHEAAVVKGVVGAGGRGVVVVDPADPVGAGGLDEVGPGPWVVQPLVASVRTEGEHSVYVFDGEPTAQATKWPAGAEIRVHPHYGGTTAVVDLAPEAADLARHSVAAAEGLLGVRLAYARVDLLRLADGRLAVSEVEATEPGLYLDEMPGNAARFVQAALLNPGAGPSRAGG